MTPVCASLRRYLYEGAYSKDSGKEWTYVSEYKSSDQDLIWGQETAL